MDIIQLVQHEADVKAAIQMAFILVCLITLMGLTWFAFGESNARRAERRRHEELEQRYQRLVAFYQGVEGKRGAID